MQTFSIPISSTTAAANKTEWQAAWGARVRLLPSARFFRRTDSQWAASGWGQWASGGWARLVEKAPGVEPHYSEDDFIHHGVRRPCCAALGILRRLLSRLAVKQQQETRPAPRIYQSVARDAFDHGNITAGRLNRTCTPPPGVLISGKTLSEIFHARDRDCPVATPHSGAPAQFDMDLLKGKAWSATARRGRVRRRNQTKTNLDGSSSQSPRPCWKTETGPWAPAERAIWTC